MNGVLQNDSPTRNENAVRSKNKLVEYRNITRTHKISENIEKNELYKYGRWFILPSTDGLDGNPIHNLIAVVDDGRSDPHRLVTSLPSKLYKLNLSSKMRYFIH
jgi:hypothetical protein